MFETKDAFWHGENITVRNSVVKGEYLAWYSNGLTLENCRIIGTQPLCYCKNLKLISCEMIDCDLAFEKSEVEAKHHHTGRQQLRIRAAGTICVPPSVRSSGTTRRPKGRSSPVRAAAPAREGHNPSAWRESASWNRCCFLKGILIGVPVDA